jgi:hypothetical protein
LSAFLSTNYQCRKLKTVYIKVSRPGDSHLMFDKINV